MKMHSCSDASNTQFLLPLLKAFLTVFVDGSHPRSVADELFLRIVGGVFEQSRDALLSQTQNDDTCRILDLLLNLIDTFGDKLFSGVDQGEVRPSFLTTPRYVDIHLLLRR
jgi:hypothetical protein